MHALAAPGGERTKQLSLSLSHASMEEDNLTLELRSQITSLQNRIKELEIENANLASQIAQCRCTKVEGQDSTNAIANSGVLVEETELLKDGVGKSRKKRSNDRDSKRLHHLPKRYIALKVMYFGQRYYGFASDAQMEPTVEYELFKAFERTRLLIGDKKEAHYSRCGRTDRGVSAAGQVIALYLRSNLKAETNSAGVISEEEYEGEIDYVKVLNRVLPKDIRIIGWCPVPLDFHARFSCLSREYKYFFWRENLDISAMKNAGKKFLGEHDFRNFCKMDAMNVHNYKRCVTSFDIIPISERFGGKELCAIKINGSAFLWHQVRCMVAILFMIGFHLESSDIIDVLLDIGRTPKKPQYIMAPEIPLVLHSCEFSDLQFFCSADARQALSAHLENEYKNLMLQAAIFHDALDNCSPMDDGGRTSLRERASTKKSLHVPILTRPTEPSYEERRAKLSSKELKQGFVELSLGTEATENGE